MESITINQNEIEIINNVDFTYGESHTIEKMSIKMINGVFTKTVRIEKKPKPLSRQYKKGGSEAGKYYSKKLNKYWEKIK